MVIIVEPMKMFDAVFAKRYIHLLIVFALLDFCIAIKMLQNEAALHFAYQWLSIPKMYIGVILPTKYSLKVHDVVLLT